MFAGNLNSSIGDTINVICLKFTILGGIVFVCAWVGEACFKSSGLRQSAEWRKVILTRTPCCLHPTLYSPTLNPNHTTLNPKP
jgi:hypothetical protein